MNKAILIAEDDNFFATIFSKKLTAAGFDVVTAHDGQECLEKIKEKKPDLLLLDLIMPKMDGFETLKAIKANAELKSIPVVVMSNLEQKEDIAKAKELGAKDFIVKTDLDSIVSAVSKLV